MGTRKSSGWWGIPNCRTGLLESGDRAWRRIVRGWRDQYSLKGRFFRKTGAKVSESGPDRRKEDRLQVHEPDASGVGAAVGDDAERGRFPHRPRADPKAVVPVSQLFQACFRAAAGARMSRADRSRRFALRYSSHPDHGAGGQDQQEHGTGQNLHRTRLRRTEPGRNEAEGRVRVTERGGVLYGELKISRGGPNERSRASWLAVPSSGFPPGRSVPPTRRWSPQPRPAGSGRVPTARMGLRWRRPGRASLRR